MSSLTTGDRIVTPIGRTGTIVAIPLCSLSIGQLKEMTLQLYFEPSAVLFKLQLSYD